MRYANYHKNNYEQNQIFLVSVTKVKKNESDFENRLEELFGHDSNPYEEKSYRYKEFFKKHHHQKRRQK